MKVEYPPDLQKYEDIALTHHVMRSGGHTLKCQKFCFWAAHSGEGGCSEQRQKKEGGTQLADLMPIAAFCKLQEEQKKIIKELHVWVQSKERLWKHKVDSGIAVPKRSHGGGSGGTAKAAKKEKNEARQKEKNEARQKE